MTRQEKSAASLAQQRLALSARQNVTFTAQARWGTRTATVWINHLDLLLTYGDPTPVRRSETRLLVRNNSGSSGYG